jgi:hypothetical protein
MGATSGASFVLAKVAQAQQQRTSSVVVARVGATVQGVAAEEGAVGRARAKEDGKEGGNSLEGEAEGKAQRNRMATEAGRCSCATPNTCSSKDW